MAPLLVVLIIICGGVFLAILWFLATYNSLVAMRNQAKNAWSQIDVQLKRRHDLIPNIVETVKGYAKHERETLDAVIKARNVAASANGVAAQAKAEGELSGVLSRLFALAEAYPDLKANQNYLALQEELSSTENKIAFSRQAYNDAVMIFNTRTQMIPANIVAGMGGFTPMEMFELKDDAQREAPQVKF
jgi:LemA protein